MAEPIPVLLRLAEAQAGRLAATPGARPVADPAGAAVLVADAPPGPGDPPSVVLAEGQAAAQRALRAGARAVLPPDASAAELAAVLPAVARGFAVVPPGVLAGLAAGRRRRRRAAG